ncbi:hypothetical protein SAMN05216505_12251 [Streptomyces prasinopilosus]|uniref:Uncharacterized protein n=2 Tax=Streptomyces prasinopilosus TaxID=67344 RepID=A0A1G7BCF7_9ACTN|nr:hypothetical protein SAMN05216505_12251 [Streptomyces prasinopilosus]
MTLFVQAFHGRGPLPAAADAGLRVMAKATSGTWTIMFRPTALPKELVAKAGPNKGMIQVGVLGKCYRP